MTYLSPKPCQMMSGRLEDVPLLDEGEFSSGPRSFCDGRAAVIDIMGNREHQITDSGEIIIINM